MSDMEGMMPELTLDPQEMKAVAKFFGKDFLREVDEGEFYDKLGEVRKAVGDRPALRAMHSLTTTGWPTRRPRPCGTRILRNSSEWCGPLASPLSSGFKMCSPRPAPSSRALPWPSLCQSGC